MSAAPELPRLLPDESAFRYSRWVYSVGVGLVGLAAAASFLVPYIEQAPLRAAEASLDRVELPDRWSMDESGSQGNETESGFAAWRIYDVDLGAAPDESDVETVIEEVRAAVTAAGWTVLDDDLRAPSADELADGDLAAGVYDLTARTGNLDAAFTVLFAYEAGSIRASSFAAVAESIDHSPFDS